MCVGGCTHIYVHTCQYGHTYTCTHVGMVQGPHANMDPCTCVRVCLYMHACTHHTHAPGVSIHVSMYRCHACMLTQCTNISRHVPACMHTDMLLCVYMLSHLFWACALTSVHMWSHNAHVFTCVCTHMVSYTCVLGDGPMQGTNVEL